MKKILSLALLLSVTGCAAPGALEVASTLGSWAVDGLVEAETGKGTVDKVISEITGKDCTLKNFFKKNEKICKELLEQQDSNK